MEEKRNTLAIINPIPLVPPVTRATRPSTEKSVLICVDAILEAQDAGTFNITHRVAIDGSSVMDLGRG